MKKILAVAMVATMLIAGYSISAKADSTSATVPLSFSVPAAFGFTLDTYSHDFGTVNAGAGGR